MADIDAVCNDRCGCPVPCPGGDDCRCTTGTEAGAMQHSICTCGSYCGCNPCFCGVFPPSSGAGKAHCRCGEDCTCVTCASRERAPVTLFWVLVVFIYSHYVK